MWRIYFKSFTYVTGNNPSWPLHDPFHQSSDVFSSTVMMSPLRKRSSFDSSGSMSNIACTLYFIMRTCVEGNFPSWPSQDPFHQLPWCREKVGLLPTTVLWWKYLQREVWLQVVLVSFRQRTALWPCHSIKGINVLYMLSWFSLHERADNKKACNNYSLLHRAVCLSLLHRAVCLSLLHRAVCLSLLHNVHN